MTNIILFSQIISKLDRQKFNKLVKEKQTDKHQKSFNSWTHLVSMLFCQFAKSQSVRDISNGLRSATGNLNHLGIQKAPSKSTISYQNKNRDWELFKSYYFELLNSLGQQAKFKQVKFKIKSKIFLLDSTTISLCLNLFDWAKYKAHKGAVKMHTLLDYDGNLPAYNASKTLLKTYNEIPFDIVDEVILVDDNSTDNTIDVAKSIGIVHIIKHKNNTGYGGNQKTCYNKALGLGADIIIMLHPDYQYTPKLIHSMSYLIANDLYPTVLGSRILGKGALKGGMPIYKYISNRILTFVQNVLMNQKLSEYHSGYRAYSKEVLQNIDFNKNSDDFIFDNQLLAQIFAKGYEIAEITCPTKYFKEASSINIPRSIVYGLGS